MNVIAGFDPFCGIAFKYHKICQRPQQGRITAAGPVAGDHVRMFLVNNISVWIFAPDPGQKIKITFRQDTPHADRKIIRDLTGGQQDWPAVRQAAQIFWRRSPQIIFGDPHIHELFPQFSGPVNVCLAGRSRIYEVF